ncbi:hypothetical protein LINPERPRIM_LOCUS37161 [Linum perenne]
MTFTNATEVRTAIKKHAITERKDVKFKKNEPKRIRLSCKRLGCRWKFFVLLNKRFNYLQLEKYKIHSCSEHYKNKLVNTKTAAERYKMQIRSNPLRFISELKLDFWITLSIMNVWCRIILEINVVKSEVDEIFYILNNDIMLIFEALNIMNCRTIGLFGSSGRVASLSGCGFIGLRVGLLTFWSIGPLAGLGGFIESSQHFASSTSVEAFHPPQKCDESSMAHHHDCSFPCCQRRSLKTLDRDLNSGGNCCIRQK